MKVLIFVVLVLAPTAALALGPKAALRKAVPQPKRSAFTQSCQDFTGAWKGTCTQTSQNGETETTEEQVTIRQNHCHSLQIIDVDGSSESVTFGTLKEERETHLRNGQYGGWSYPSLTNFSTLWDWNKEKTQLNMTLHAVGFPEPIGTHGGAVEMKGSMRREGDVLKVEMSGNVEVSKYSCSYSRQ